MSGNKPGSRNLVLCQHCVDFDNPVFPSGVYMHPTNGCRGCSEAPEDLIFKNSPLLEDGSVVECQICQEPFVTIGHQTWVCLSCQIDYPDQARRLAPLSELPTTLKSTLDPETVAIALSLIVDHIKRGGETGPKFHLSQLGSTVMDNLVQRLEALVTADGLSPEKHFSCERCGGDFPEFWTNPQTPSEKIRNGYKVELSTSLYAALSTHEGWRQVVTDKARIGPPAPASQTKKTKELLPTRERVGVLTFPDTWHLIPGNSPSPSTWDLSLGGAPHLSRRPGWIIEHHSLDPPGIGDDTWYKVLFKKGKPERERVAWVHHSSVGRHWHPDRHAPDPNADKLVLERFHFCSICLRMALRDCLDLMIPNPVVRHAVFHRKNTPVQELFVPISPSPSRPTLELMKAAVLQVLLSPSFPHQVHQATLKWWQDNTPVVGPQVLAGTLHPDLRVDTCQTPNCQGCIISFDGAIRCRRCHLNELDQADDPPAGASHCPTKGCQFWTIDLKPCASCAYDLKAGRFPRLARRSRVDNSRHPPLRPPTPIPVIYPGQSTPVSEAHSTTSQKAFLNPLTGLLYTQDPDAPDIRELHYDPPQPLFRTHSSDGDLPSGIREQPSPSSRGSLSNRPVGFEVGVHELNEALIHSNMDTDEGQPPPSSTEYQPAGAPRELEVGTHTTPTHTNMDIEPQTPPRQEPPPDTHS